MHKSHLTQIIEALLLTSQQPLSIEVIQSVFEGELPDKEEIKEALNALKNDYMNRSFDLIHLATGYQLQTKKEYRHWVTRLNVEKPAKYSRALLETLAIIAYKQPVSRADIEEIRGVGVSSPIMKTLLEREWIRIAGHKDIPGKPAVYTTTKTFLDYFNLHHLNELPSLPLVMETVMMQHPEEECETQ